MVVKKRGRPSKSIVRERLKEILAITGKLSAYDAHKLYSSLFAKTTQRNVYYQLAKGVDTNDFTKEEVLEQGTFSWGATSRKVYYSLSSHQRIVVSDYVRKALRGKV
ncbi:MAG: hypothetical protein ACOCQQ_00710 [Candidatus Nanoarchaeia archaeon]